MVDLGQWTAVDIILAVDSQNHVTMLIEHNYTIKTEIPGSQALQLYERNCVSSPSVDAQIAKQIDHHDLRWNKKLTAKGNFGWNHVSWVNQL